MENWKPISNFECAYEVSDLGHIRSLPRRVNIRWLGATRPVRGKLLTPNISREGYFAVHLYCSSRLTKRYVHRVVAEAFVPNPQGLPQVNHLDGDKGNNAAFNLEWCTGSANCQHAIDNSLYLMARGSRAANAKIDEKAALDIRARAACGVMHKVLAAEYGVGRKEITKIVNRQRWKHV